MLTSTKYPVISCILTTYNRSQFLKRSIDSIVNQTYTNLEILIIDDCSSENIKKIINLYNDKRIKYIRHNINKGLAHSRNTGMKNSTGDYFAFLDDDDEWLPNKIADQLKIFQNSKLKNLGMVTCGIRRIKGKKKIEYKEILRGNLFYEFLIEQPLVGNGSCVLIKSEVYRKYGGFDTKYKRGIDGYFFCKISNYYQIDFSEQILVNYYEDDKNRITSYTNPEKIKDGIDGLFYRYEENKKSIKKYPKLTLKFNLLVAESYIYLNDYRNVINFFFKSIGYYAGLRKYLLFLFYMMFPSLISKILRQKRK